MMYVLVPPITLISFMLPKFVHLTSCNDTLSTDNQFTTVVLFHFRKSTVMYALVVSMQNSQESY